MIFREAILEDIPQIQVVRHAVKENRLSDPGLVTDKDCEEYLFIRGKGWVCEFNHRIIGFAILDLTERNIWALFVHPEFEQLGLGKKLQGMMLGWYFTRYKETLWLGTAPHTRAEIFYRKTGWRSKGMRPNGELRFEMSSENWTNRFC